MFSKISFGKKNISEVHNVPSTLNVVDCMLFGSLHEASSCCIHWTKLIMGMFDEANHPAGSSG